MHSVSVGADISQGDFIVIDLLKIGEELSCKDLSVKMGLSVSRSGRIVDRIVRKGHVLRKALKSKSQRLRATEIIPVLSEVKTTNAGGTVDILAADRSFHKIPNGPAKG
jgi:hypothetical protein